MGDNLRMAIGIMGNAASLLLYSAPILTFKRVIKKQSTEEFSCLPYIVALFNCLMYTWYGFPVVSVKWENFPLITINGLGILLEISFIMIYIWFASAQGKKLVLLMVVPVICVFCGIASVSTFVIHDHHHRKVLVGSAGLVASVSMYAAPLVAAKQVIKTKSVEYMPFYLSFFSFVASLFWLTYGLLGRDLFLASPNFIGCPLGFFQLVLYFVYRGKKGTPRDPVKLDLEKNELQLKSCQVNGKN